MTVIGRPLAVVPLPPVPRAVQHDQQSDGAPSFANLLGGLVMPCNGATQFLGSSDVASPVDIAGLQHASVFNQHGLFNGPIAGVTPTAPEVQRPVAEPSAAAAVAPTLPPLDVVLQAAVGGLVPSASEQDGRGFDAAVRSSEDVPHRAAHNDTLSVRLPARAASSEIAAGSFAAIDIREFDAPSQSSGTPRAAKFVRIADTAGDNAVELFLRAADKGQLVVATIGTLDREQRVKLRDRIAGMLSRHGLIPLSVRINGRLGGPKSTDKGR